MTNARKGKIARLPHAVREKVNHRLQAGEPASKILAWLHTREDVLRVLDEHFSEQPISPQNLSEWRSGGYQDWLRKRDNLDRVKELSQHALQIAESGGGDLMSSSTAIAGGQILEILESLDPEAQKALIAEKPETYIDLLDRLARLQKSGAEARRATVSEKASTLAERRLDLDQAKFERQTCELFVKFYADQQARELADNAKNGKDKKVNMDNLRTLIFGKPPEES